MATPSRLFSASPYSTRCSPPLEKELITMRIAVFSDIHANQEALQAFMDHSDHRAVDRYVCLGDIVGYGASPNKCITMLQALPDVCFILGNHDNAAVGNASRMNTRADKAITWTRNRLSAGSIDFLKRMQLIITWEHLSFSHTTPYRPLSWSYVVQKSIISKTFARTKTKIAFVGHTHAPSIITRQNFFCVYIRRPQHNTVVPAATLKRQIFNCGSIGQPRDGDPRASYLIYDTRHEMVEFHRITYDHAKAAQKIVDAGLPRALANRLATGT